MVPTLEPNEVPVPMQETMIVCKNLTKRYGDFLAVDEMNLCIKRGELFGFLGPNGAGKTTTIKMLIGLLHPTSGYAEIGGYDIQRFPLQAKSIIGYIPDNPFLYEKLTGKEYLQFIADLYSVPTKEKKKLIVELLELFELTEKGDELIQGYSRGMRQKIAMAGALIHDPQVIFLDEPTVGLDPRGARSMRETLQELCRRGKTVFMSTHILEVAEKTCDRIAIVKQGKILMMGTMQEIREEARRIKPDTDTSGSLEDIFLELTGDALAS